MKFKNIIRSPIYGVSLSYLTISEVIYCRGLLKKQFLQHLTLAEFKDCRSILRGAYISCGIANSLLYEYNRMIEGGNDFAHELSTLILAIMYLEDVLIDEHGTSLENIDRLFKDPNGFNPTTTTEALTIKLYQHVLSKIPEGYKDKQVNLLLKLHDAQLEGAMKKRPGISFGELRRLDFNKGIWFPLLALPYNPEMSEREIKVLKHFGVLLKYIDDLYDRKKDGEVGGEISLFSLPGYEDKALKFFQNYCDLVMKIVEDLDYSVPTKREFVFRMQFLSGLCLLLYRFILKPLRIY